MRNIKQAMFHRQHLRHNSYVFASCQHKTPILTHLLHILRGLASRRRGVIVPAHMHASRLG